MNSAGTRKPPGSVRARGRLIKYDEPSQILTGTVNIRQVKLSTGGDSFTGTLIIDVYDEVSLT